MTSGVRTRSQPSGLLTLDFARAYVVTMRPYLLFVSGVAGVAGLALGPTLAVGDTLLLAAAFFLSYGFGQALTDCFQLDTDSLSSPYRPLVRGVIRPRDVLGVSLAGLALCGGIVVSYHTGTLVLAALTVIGLSTYTWFKRRWWAGPFYNAWIVALLPLLGRFAAGGTGSWWSPGMAGTLAMTFFGYANFVLTGYFKDISADRATGYRTLPVVFGLGASRLVSHGLAAMSAAACSVVVLRSTSPGAVAFFAAGLAAAVLGQVRLEGVRDEKAAHRAIGPVVHAFILLHAAVGAAAKPAWAVPLALFYGAFRWTMNRRPAREQI